MLTVSAGRSNYTLRRLVRLWLNMFTTFSILPLRFASYMGLLMSGGALLLAVFFALAYLVGGIFSDQAIPPGWASLIVTATFFAGLQLSVLGMIGEYVGRLYLTQNKQPQYVVRRVFESEADRPSRTIDETSPARPTLQPSATEGGEPDAHAHRYDGCELNSTQEAPQSETAPRFPR